MITDNIINTTIRVRPLIYIIYRFLGFSLRITMGNGPTQPQKFKRMVGGSESNSGGVPFTFYNEQQFFIFRVTLNQSIT